MQVRATLRCRAGEHEATDQARAQEHELLGDVAAEREAQQIDLLQAEGVDERERVASHGGDVLRDDARRAANTAVVDEDDLSILRQAVDERRVPVVEVPPEVLEHHQRGRGRLRIAEAAVDERHVSDLEREVLGRQLTVLRRGNKAFVGQGFGCTHGFPPLVATGRTRSAHVPLVDAEPVIWLPPGESTYHGAPKPVEPCPVVWPDAVSPVKR